MYGAQHAAPNVVHVPTGRPVAKRSIPHPRKLLIRCCGVLGKCWGLRTLSANWFILRINPSSCFACNCYGPMRVDGRTRYDHMAHADLSMSAPLNYLYQYFDPSQRACLGRSGLTETKAKNAKMPARGARTGLGTRSSLVQCIPITGRQHQLLPRAT